MASSRLAGVLGTLKMLAPPTLALKIAIDKLAVHLVVAPSRATSFIPFPVFQPGHADVTPLLSVCVVFSF